MKYNRQDFVIVYSGTPTREEGMLGRILDRDPHDKTYMVVSLEEIYQCGGDEEKLYDSGGLWVSEDNISKIEFGKPSVFSKVAPYLLILESFALGFIFNILHEL